MILALSAATRSGPAPEGSIKQLATQPNIECEGPSNALLKLLGGNFGGNSKTKLTGNPLIP